MSIKEPTPRAQAPKTVDFLGLFYSCRSKSSWVNTGGLQTH